MVCSLKEKKQNKSTCVSIVNVQYPNAHKGMSLDIAIISSYASYDSYVFHLNALKNNAGVKFPILTYHTSLIVKSLDI